MIAALAIFWYALVPLVGSFIIRQEWRNFRRRFNDLRLKPILNYGTIRFADKNAEMLGEYRFTGSFESISDGKTLWLKNDNLTIPVDLNGAKSYLLPNNPDEDLPEKINWNRPSTLTGEARVYVGGTLVIKEKRPVFSSSPGNPLLIILYEGSEYTLSDRTMKSGRYKNKYLNYITPYSHIMGALSQVMMAVYLFDRPARRPAMIAAFIALFAPIIPILPPGIIFAMLYRRLWWRARLCRAYRDLARLPLLYIANSDEEPYGMRQYETLPEAFAENKFPFIIPETEKKSRDKWHVFGILKKDENDTFFSAPADPLAVYGALPGEPETLARRYEFKAWALEIVSWILFGIGIAINMILIRVLLFMTGII